MIPLPSLRIAAAFVLALGLAASLRQAYVMGAAKTEAAWAKEQRDTAKQMLRLMEKTTRTSMELQDNADRLRRNKDAKLAKLDADLADALGRLSDRPARPGAGDLSKDAGTGASPGCTAASLYAEDAGAFVREAARSDRILADLAQCQAAYGAARAAVN